MVVDLRAGKEEKKETVVEGKKEWLLEQVLIVMRRAMEMMVEVVAMVSEAQVREQVQSKREAEEEEEEEAKRS